MSLWKGVPAFYNIIIRKAGGKRIQNSVCSVCAKLRLLWQPESGPVPVAMAEDDWVMTFIQHQEMFSILRVQRHSGGKVCHKWKAVKAFIVKQTCLFWDVSVLREAHSCPVSHRLFTSSAVQNQLITRRLQSSSIFLFYLNTAEYLPASPGLPLLKTPYMWHCLICLCFLVTLDLADCVSDCPFINSCCRLFQERGVGAPVT